jgi:hypothetical protein
MAVVATPIFVQAPKNGKVQILNADASNLKTIYTADADGSKISAIIATSSDTSAREVTVGITNGGTFFPLGTFNIPITAGQVAGANAVNLLDPTIIKGLPLDNDGAPYLLLISGDTLQAKALTTVTSTKEIDITAIGADF